MKKRPSISFPTRASSIEARYPGRPYCRPRSSHHEAFRQLKSIFTLARRTYIILCTCTQPWLQPTGVGCRSPNVVLFIRSYFDYYYYGILQRIHEAICLTHFIDFHVFQTVNTSFCALLLMNIVKFCLILLHYSSSKLICGPTIEERKLNFFNTYHHWYEWRYPI